MRDAIAAKTVRDSGYACEAPQVLVTNGGKHAVYNTFQALLDPGDEVILPAPYWTTYPEAIALADGVSVVLPDDRGDPVPGHARAPRRRADRQRTKALVFVSPSNPTGSVYTPEEIEAIARWAVHHDVWVITDEIYEHLTYDDHRFTSMPALVPEIADTCVVLNGVAKTYAMTGWRVGWMIGPRDVIAAATNLQSHSTSNVANVSQLAALAAVVGDLDAWPRCAPRSTGGASSMHRLLESIPGVTCMEPQGAFYCFPNFEGVLGREIAGRQVDTTLDLCEVLLDVAKVAIVPGEAFGAPGYARLSFALGDDDLGEGVGRIAQALEE